MKVCYLHFGMPKTGSTAIQKALYRYADDRIEYADLENSNHGMQIVTGFSNNPKSFYILKNRKTSRNDARRIAAESLKAIDAATSKEKSVIFSAEAVPDHMSQDEISKLVKYMDSKFDRLQVVMYLRPLPSLLASQLQQRIKSGLGNFSLPSPDYKKRMLPLIQACGPERIVFREYSRASLKNEDIVEDFCSIVGLRNPRKRNTPSNSSLSTEAIAKIFAFNKYIGPHLPVKQRTNVRNALKKDLIKFGSNKFTLSAALVQAHIDKHSDDVKWAEHASGFDLTSNQPALEGGVSSGEDLLKYLQ